MAACRALVSRGLLVVGVHYQHVSRGVLLTHSREMKRWMKTSKFLEERKRRIEGQPLPKPRSQQPNWDYHAEVEAFSARLKEGFSTDLLKTAFVNPCYIRFEEERRRSLGLDAEVAALNLKDNAELRECGHKLTLCYLTNWCTDNFPRLPEDGVAAIVDYLTSSDVVCNVAKNLALDELAMVAEFPVPDDVLLSMFFAVIGALEKSSGSQQTGLFIRDFLVTQLIGRDLFDMWKLVNPMGLLVEELSRRGVTLPEPRLIKSFGASTVLPLHFIGLYCDQKLLSYGPGETISAAEDEAARVALRKLFGYMENRKPFDFYTTEEFETAAADERLLFSSSPSAV